MPTTSARPDAGSSLDPTATRRVSGSWCLTGLAAYTPSVEESERRLEQELGHAPTLPALVEDLMARLHMAAPFTAPPPSTAPTPRADRSR